MVDPARAEQDDAARAIRFMVVKAAIFIGIPLVAALIAALVIVMR